MNLVCNVQSETYTMEGTKIKLSKWLLLVESISSQLFSHTILTAFDISFDAVDVCHESVNLSDKEVDRFVSVWASRR